MKQISSSFFSVTILLLTFVWTVVLDGKGLAPSAPGESTPAVEQIQEDNTSTALNGSDPMAFMAPIGLGHLNAFGPDLPSLLNPSKKPQQPANTLVLPNLRKLVPLPAQRLQTLDNETLWLARGIFSETKRPEEQELIAWVIRNRVETQYRGKNTFRDVVLDPYQFSAFIPGTSTRDYYTRLTPSSKVPGWQHALRIAYEVRQMPEGLRPFSQETRHFYSEQSMVGQKHPAWATGLMPVKPVRDYSIEAKRFRFFDQVS